MAIDRETAQNLGLLFADEGTNHPSDPDQTILTADATVEGHTISFQGKSEEDILAQFEAYLVAKRLPTQPRPSASWGT